MAFEEQLGGEQAEDGIAEELQALVGLARRGPGGFFIESGRVQQGGLKQGESAELVADALLQIAMGAAAEDHHARGWWAWWTDLRRAASTCV